jgi:hypothetical protein
LRLKQPVDDARSGHSILDQITRDYLLIFFHCLFQSRFVGGLGDISEGFTGWWGWGEL